MRLLYLHIALAILFIGCKSSKNIIEEENDDIIICAYCGYGGSLDKEFNIVEHQYLIKDTITLLNQFENGTGKLKLFSALSLNRLIISKYFHSNKTINNKMNEYKRSKEIIRIYQFCTESYSTTIWSLFNDKNNSTNNIINNILFK